MSLKGAKGTRDDGGEPRAWRYIRREASREIESPPYVSFSPRRLPVLCRPAYLYSQTLKQADSTDLSKMMVHGPVLNLDGRILGFATRDSVDLFPS